jgi:hypothetical protein
MTVVPLALAGGWGIPESKEEDTVVGLTTWSSTTASKAVLISNEVFADGKTKPAAKARKQATLAAEGAESTSEIGNAARGAVPARRATACKE